MEYKQILTELGDPLLVGRLIEKLKISSDDFKIESRISKLEKVVKYLSNVEDPEHFIMRALGSKQVDKLDFISEYIDINQNFEEAKNELYRINKRLEMYTYDKPVDEISPQEIAVYENLTADRLQAERRLQDVKTEIAVYER